MAKTTRLYDTPKDPKYTNCKSFDFPLYPCTLHVGIEDDLENGIAVTYHSGSNFYVILERNSMTDASIICHESFHVLERSAAYLGEGLTGEAGAYLIEWIVKTILSVTVKEKSLKRKKK